MKKIRLGTGIICFLFGIALTGIISCKKNAHPDESLPSANKIYTYPVGIDTGYNLYPAFITEFPERTFGTYTSQGKRIPSAIPYPITSEIIPQEEFLKQKTTPIGNPTIKTAFSNIHPVILENWTIRPDLLFNNDTLYLAKLNEPFINSRGDTLLTNTPMEVNEKFFKAPMKSWSASPPVRRHDASLNIKILDKESGLSLTDVNTIMQDSRGYFWFGLDGRGVDWYDGCTFSYFKPKLEDIKMAVVRDLLEDRTGNLWMATYGGGANRYNGIFFTPFAESEGMTTINIRCLEEDQYGNIWFGTREKGASRYQPPSHGKKGTLTHFGPKEGLTGLDIFDILEDKKSNLWFATDRGIYKYEHNAQSNQDSFHLFISGEQLPGKQVLSIMEDSQGDMWFGTNGGACYFQTSSSSVPGNFTHIKLRPGKKELPVSALHEDRNGNIWFGTIGNGAISLSRVDFEKNTNGLATHYTTEEGLPDNRINTILEDSTGNIVLGIQGGGVAIIGTRSFSHLGEKEGFSQSVVNCIFEDRNHNLWFGLLGDDPLICYQSATNGKASTFLHYPFPHEIKSITQDQQGDFWFGTFQNGICRFNGKTFTCYNTYTQSASYVINSAILDRSGRIWAGTRGGGLYCILPEYKTGKSTPVFVRYNEKNGLPDDQVRSVYEDSQGDIWICSSEGISKLELSENTNSGIITHFNDRSGLLHKLALSVVEDNKHRIWMGTVRGTSIYTPPQGDNPGIFTHIDLRGFFKFDQKIISEQRAMSLLEDANNNIWIGTLTGLVMIEKEEENELQNNWVRFSKADGLREEEFEENSSVFDSRNQAWWGGSSGGVELLDLNTLSISQHILQPKLRRVDINGNHHFFNLLPDSLRREIRFDSIPPFENYPLDPVLSYKNRHLTFFFTALDWTAQHKIYFSFRLKGLEENWSSPTIENKAEYRGLNFGKYTFQVRAYGESKLWSEPVEYSFTILPPWWLSWWACVLYGSIIVIMVYRLYRYQLKRRFEIEEKKRLVELDQLKNNLFTNITHEFRTPLTLIHGPLSHALTTYEPLEQKDMQSMYQHSKRLQQLITQILDLQKAEAGKLKPVYTYGDIADYIRYLFEAFGSFAREKNITLTFSATPKHINMDFDEDKTTQIITNIVSNAIKHTPPGGTVSLTLMQDNHTNKLRIRIADTGVGIGEQDLPFVFDRYYQASRAAEGGTGIGLALSKTLVELLQGAISVESEVSKGTVIKITLPISHQTRNAALRSQPKDIAYTDLLDDESRFSVAEEMHTDLPIVLIVEDHPEVAQFIASCLRKDFSIMIARDGEEGISKAFNHIPDLVISDVMMPGKDGFELCATLKKDIHTSHIPVILLTGRGDQAARMQGIEEGADAYVLKPFEPAELLLRVKKLLELRKSLREHYRTYTHGDDQKIPDHISIKEHDFLAKIRAFVEEHINDPQLNMQALTRHMAMSHPQLHRKITALTGESAGKLVRSIRLAKAIELLKHSDLSVSEIAYEIGYSEPAYFTKVFSKEYNVTPTEYRAGV